MFLLSPLPLPSAGEERYLEQDERILDLVAYWQRLFEEEKQKVRLHAQHHAPQK